MSDGMSDALDLMGLAAMFTTITVLIHPYGSGVALFATMLVASVWWSTRVAYRLWTEGDS